MSLLKSSTSKNCNRHNNILTSSDYSSAVHDFNQLPSELISRLYALCQQLINQLNYSKHVVFCIFVLLLSCSLCDALPPYHHANDDLTDRNDFVCNVGNGYECICNRGNGNLEDQIEECTEFFGVSFNKDKNEIQPCALTQRFICLFHFAVPETSLKWFFGEKKITAIKLYALIICFACHFSLTNIVVLGVSAEVH